MFKLSRFGKLQSWLTSDWMAWYHAHFAGLLGSLPAPLLYKFLFTFIHSSHVCLVAVNSLLPRNIRLTWVPIFTTGNNLMNYRSETTCTDESVDYCAVDSIIG